MSNLNNITSKILKDSEEKRDEILAKAKEEEAKIISKKKDEAEKLKFEMIEKTKIEAETRRERIISGAQLKVRNEKLVSKGQVIDKAFEESIVELCKMDGAKFKEFIRETILKMDLNGDENIILNDEGRKVIDLGFINRINKELGPKGKLKIATETRNFKGGFIVEKDGIEINNTFEALVNSQREELENEIAQVLFN